MKKRISFINLIQAFALGAIAMAYVADYNRSQLPLALMLLGLGLLFSE